MLLGFVSFQTLKDVILFLLVTKVNMKLRTVIVALQSELKEFKLVIKNETVSHNHTNYEDIIQEISEQNSIKQN